MSDVFSEVTSIYYCRRGVSHIQQVHNGRDTNDARCMSSAGVNDLSSYKWLQLMQLPVYLLSRSETLLLKLQSCSNRGEDTRLQLLNYRELRLIRMPQSASLTQEALHCINVQIAQICKQINLQRESVSLTCNFKAISMTVMVFAPIVRTTRHQTLGRKGVLL